MDCFSYKCDTRGEVFFYNIRQKFEDKVYYDYRNHNHVIILLQARNLEKWGFATKSISTNKINYSFSNFTDLFLKWIKKLKVYLLDLWANIYLDDVIAKYLNSLSVLKLQSVYLKTKSFKKKHSLMWLEYS